MNLWHEIEAGSKSQMNVIVEINKGSNNKYEIDKKTGLIALDRVSHTSQAFPFDYGFVPQTLWHDNDPLDVILLTTYPLLPGILVRARPVAIMNMIDSGEGDDKIIAVPADDPRWSDIKYLQDINKHTLKEIQHFFETYKQIQKKEVSVPTTRDAKAAMEVIVEGIELYKKEFNK